MITTPVVIAASPASATTPAFGIGAYSYFKIKITGHVTEHVAPDIIEGIEAGIPAIISTPVIATIIVPGHVPGNSGS
jgi:hypothetical protein